MTIRFRFISCASLVMAFATTFAYAQVGGLCDKNHYILRTGVCILPAVPAVFTGTNPWTAIGPDGANVMTLAIDPRTPATVFAGTAGVGVLKSADGGANWVTLNHGLSTLNVGVIVIDSTVSTTVYAGTDDGVFKSTDGGQNWVAARTGFDGAAAAVIYSLAIDPGSPATLYAGTSSGLYKSTDAGASWTRLGADYSGITMRLIAIDPASPSTVYVAVEDNGNWDTWTGEQNGLLKSTDGGASWNKIYAATCGVNCHTSFTALAIDSRAPSTMYAAVVGSRLMRSLDGGASWSTFASSPMYVTSIQFDPMSATNIYVSASTGAAFRSTDAGEHWTPLNDALLSYGGGYNAVAMTPSVSPTVYVGTGLGISRSAEGAQGWTRLTLGVAAHPVGRLAIDPMTPSTIYASTGEGFGKTTDGGVHWAYSTPGGVGWISELVMDPLTPTTLYAANRSLLKSTDAGEHWTPVLGLASSFYPGFMAIAASRPSTLYVLDLDKGFVKTTDAGISWTATADAVLVRPALYVDPTNDQIVYAARETPDVIAPGSGFPVIFKSTDGAANWRQLTHPVRTIGRVTALVIDPVTPTTLYLSYLSGEGPDGGVRKSIDGGETWAAAENGLAGGSVWALALDSRSPSQIYAATRSGVFRSTDGAMTWTPLPAGLPAGYGYSLAVDRSGNETLLRAATAGGLFEYRLDAIPPPTVAVIEYYHAGLDQYFITANIAEAAGLDHGTFAGWTRTGYQFNAYAIPNAHSVPVCRFFNSTFTAKSAHFYTPYAGECALLQTYGGWTLESTDAFEIALPAKEGACKSGAIPVYRMYNRGQGGVHAHRFTADPGVRAQMLAQGWVLEGIGTDVVNMCAPL